MARQTTPLTAKEIQAAKPKEKTYRLFDGGGLHLEVSPKGHKWWRLKYRINGKEKRISLGVYPHISLQEARKQRELLKEQIAKGIDPSKERKEAKQIAKDIDLKSQRTLKAVSDQYFDHLDTLKDKMGDRHRTRQYRRMENYVYTDPIAQKSIEDISRVDVLGIIRKLTEADNHEVARRVLLLIKNIIEYAIDNEYISSNVAAGIKPSKVIGKRSKKHYPVMTDDRELKGLLVSLDEYAGNFSTKQALRMMPYVALRPANIRFLEWGDVDLDEKAINIPASKMKMNEDHRIPITSSVKKILEEMQPYSGVGKYVFPSVTHKDKPLSDNTLNVGLRRLGYTKEQIVSHSFRGIFSTIAHSNMKKHGFESLVIEAQLAHKDRNESRESYNHNDYFEDRMKLMEWWDSYLIRIKEGKDAK